MILTWQTLNRWLHLLLVSIVWMNVEPSAFASDPDRDGDGLPDFQEIHKYRTNPDKADSDGDGKPDGDWAERREYAYTVHTVLRVMLPVNEREIANDDYQDARVIARTDRYVDLEVIHYPFNTVNTGITANARWRDESQSMAEYLKPGLTTNWTDGMRQALLEDLAKDGIEIDRLTDRQVVERVSAWLFKRTKSGRYFNIFHVHFPEGKAKPYPGQENAVGDRGNPRWTLEQQWDHELFGKQMYENRACGTCTSSAILLTTVLRAVGIPTRIILCTPIVDASGGTNVDLVRKGLTHHAVRENVVTALQPLKNSNASHTFCEVFVGGRWRRLNYSVLGQNILDPDLFGMLTHVNTFNDLADANLAATWGARRPDQVFRYANSYTALKVYDQFGTHSQVPNPPYNAKSPMSELVISRTYWLESDDLPDCINPEKFQKDGSGHLFFHAEKPLFGGRQEHFPAFYSQASKSFVLKAEGKPEVQVNAERGFWINSGKDHREFYLRVSPAEMKKLKKGVSYRLMPRNNADTARWTIASSVTVLGP
jgi:hypothetical protein